MKLSQIIREAVDHKLEDEGRVTADAISMYVHTEYAEILDGESERLLRQALHREIVRQLKQRAEDEGEQPALPGLGFPSAIYVPDGDYYVSRDAARWSELIAGRQVRVDNIHRAQQQLDRYDNDLDRVRPWMEGTERTLAEAIKQMRDAA